MKRARVKTSKAVGAIVLGLVLASVVWIALRWNAPPVTIVRNGADIYVDVSTLGEYPTTVSRIRLSNLNSGTVVWELQASQAAQIHGFRLAEGANPIQIESDDGSYRAVVPSGSNTFQLRRGAEYRLELWSGSSVLAKRSVSFSLQDAGAPDE